MSKEKIGAHSIKDTPPHSLEAERAVLGCILLDNESLGAVLSIISPGDFYREAHRKIIAKIAALVNKSVPVDVITLSEELQKEGSLEEVGGASYLSELMDGVPKSLNVEFYASIIKEKSLYRQIMLLSTNTYASSYEQREEASLILNKAQTSFGELTDTFKEVKKVEDFSVSARIDTLEEHISIKGEGEYLGLEITCFLKLTEALDGLREIIGISAPPKVGKTAFALQIASDIAGQGYGVLYYDFESGAENLMIREICRDQNITHQEIFKKRNPESLVDGVKAGLNNLRKRKNFIIKTERSLTIEEIRSDISQVRQLTGKDEVLVVMDSLQKLPMKDLKERRAAIDRWLRDFEALKTNDRNLTIILISELSRDKQQPKESGGIEYAMHFLLRLRKNKEKAKAEDPEPKDDFKRNLILELARDAESGKQIAQYEVNFEHWKFTEDKKKSEDREGY